MKKLSILLCVVFLAVLAGASVPQGLVVYVGASSGEELANLYTGKGMLVHGLVGDAAKAAEAREVLREKKLVGPVNVSVYDGKVLPLIDNSVNILMIKPDATVSAQEILRVLAPGAVAKNLADGKTFTKPVPGDTDEWPQYLHDPGNNAVAHDDRVGPPKHLQWRAGPRWSRHHDHMSSVSAVVTAGGRIFSIMDEGSVSSILLPSKWSLIARDAFNGLRLWDRGIDEWQSRVFALKSGPATLPRRLATDGKLVFATLGLNAPVSVLDAATGKTIGELATGGYPREILLVDDMVLVVVGDEPMYVEGTKPLNKHSIHAFDKKGKKLWQHKAELCLLTLGADSKRVYFYDYKSVVSLDRKSGKKLWSTPQPRLKSVLSQDAPILVVYKDTVLFADPQYGQVETDGGSKPKAAPAKKKGGKKKGGKKKGGNKDMKLIALDAATGKELWKGDQPPTGYRSVGDVLVVDGLVWNGPVTAGSMSGIQSGRDLRTGKTEREWPPTVETYWFHHRCYRAKATDKYLMLSRTGIEYVDVKTGNWDINHYVRGACLYGVVPANGLTYAPPHPCSCYPETKLDGFVALAENSSLSTGLPKPGADAALRLEKGSAFSASPAKDATAGDWPTFRYAMDRCGYSTVNGGASVKPSWSTDMGTRATQPIVVGDRLYVSTPETHSIHALDAKSGKKIWSFTAGGKSDTPPTWYRGRLLFGANDGYVYNLNAADGKLAWRFRAAPLDRRLVQFERVESVWPVNGNILVNPRGEAVFVCGRSIFLDGGLRFIRLDAMTGKLLHESPLDRTDDRTGAPIQDGIERLNMPVGMPDLLGSDGHRYFMRSEILNDRGQRMGQAPHSTEPIDVILDRPAEDAHLFAPSGFAEDGWWHRTFWSYGSVFTGGHDGYYQAGRFTPSGRILVHDGDKVYGYRRKAEYYRWISTMSYEMYSAPRVQPPLGPEQRKMATKKSTNKIGKSNHVKKDWTGKIPIVLRAMAGAGDRLLLAGPPEMMNEKELTGDEKDRLPAVISESSSVKKIEAQQQSEDGKLGGKLIVMDPPSGKILQTVELSSPPVFDGLISANGKTYMCTLDGSIRCFE